MNHSPASAAEQTTLPEVAGGMQVDATSGKTYNHAFTVAFQIGGSTHKEGDDITPEQFYNAIIARAKALLLAGEMIEAIGLPFDTYTENDDHC